MSSDDKFIPLDQLGRTPQATSTASGQKFIPLDPAFLKMPQGIDPRIREMSNDVVPSNMDIVRTGAHALPFLLGAGGSFLGGPAGTAVGAATGSLVDSTLGSDAPLSPGEALKNAAFSGVGTYLGGKALGPIESQLSQALVNTIFGKGMKSLQGDTGPQGDGSTKDYLKGQAIDLGKDFASNLALGAGGKFLVKSFTKSSPDMRVPLDTEAARQRESLRIGIGPTTESGIPAASTPKLGAEARSVAVQNRNQAKAMQDKAYDLFRTQHEEPNSIVAKIFDHYEEGNYINPSTGKGNMVPVTRDVTIKGPIFTVKTQEAAKEMLPQLDGFLKGEVFQKLPDAIKGKYQKLAGYIRDLSEPTTIMFNGEETQVPVKEFEVLKQAKTEINQAIGGKPGPNYPEAGLKKLAAALDADQDISIQQFWKDGPAASAALEKANLATKVLKGTYDTKENRKRIFGSFETGRTDTRVPADSSQFFKDAYTSSEKTDRLIKVLGPEGLPAFKQDYFDNQLMRKSFGADGSKYQPSKMIEMLEDPNGVGRRILNSDERSNLLRFARAAQAAGEDDTRVPNAINIAGNKVAVNLGLGASRIATGSQIPARVVIAAGDFFNKLREQPQIGDTAGRLLKVRPESLEAQSKMKMILKGMKGLPMTVTIGDETREATVGENGRIKFLGQD